MAEYILCHNITQYIMVFINDNIMEYSNILGCTLLKIKYCDNIVGVFDVYNIKYRTDCIYQEYQKYILAKL